MNFNGAVTFNWPSVWFVPTLFFATHEYKAWSSSAIFLIINFALPSLSIGTMVYFFSSGLISLPAFNHVNVGCGVPDTLTINSIVSFSITVLSVKPDTNSGALVTFNLASVWTLPSSLVAWALYVPLSLRVAFLIINLCWFVFASNEISYLFGEGVIGLPLKNHCTVACGDDWNSQVNIASCFATTSVSANGLITIGAERTLISAVSSAVPAVFSARTVIGPACFVVIFLTINVATPVLTSNVVS